MSQRRSKETSGQCIISAFSPPKAWTAGPITQRAAVWFGKAAEFDVADSQFNFAVLLARGLGLRQDFAQSYTWFSILAAKGDAEAAAKRDEVATRLTSSDLAAAKMAAETFRPRPPDSATNEPVRAQAGMAAASRPTADAATPNPPAPKKDKPKLSGL